MFPICSLSVSTGKINVFTQFYICMNLIIAWNFKDVKYVVVEIIWDTIYVIKNL